MDKDLRYVRTDYQKYQLLDKDVPADPIQLFSTWLEEAALNVAKDHNAMVVSSIGVHGPASRVVLLRRFSDAGFMFYTNQESRKSQDFDHDPRVALNFFWSAMERQVRVEGIIEKCSKEESDEYFLTRPRASKLSAWASQQSRQIATRDELEKAYSDVESRFEGKEIPRPPFWGGYVVSPRSIEFWQGRQGRLHDRILYEQLKGSWKHNRLQP